MNHISNAKVHLKIRSGNVNIYTIHSFTTACVTHVDQVIKQLVVLMGIINVENGGLIGETFR